MKHFFIAMILAMLLGGCTTRDAFSQLNLNQEQESAIENTRSGKMMHKEQAGGLYSAIYLHKQDTQNITFYISLYQKENKELTFMMNKQAPLHIKKLATINKYAPLLSHQRTWTNNYLITFDSTQKSELILQIDSGLFSSGPLKYSTDLQ